ncbi:hypothetical protein [Anaerovibrio slackiae]|nr:hypothetical protein [Anaerovibrio slackiae]
MVKNINLLMKELKGNMKNPLENVSKLNWGCYYLPLRWTFATRYTNPINIISFFLIDALPSLYLVFALSDFRLELAVNWFIAFVTMFCFYECGYIFNEIVSVRYEKNPTIRIPEPYFFLILRHLENLITVRVVLGVLGSWFLMSMFPDNRGLYVFCVLLLLVTYSVHNFYRGKINALTMAIEVTLKYMIPIVIFIPDDRLITSLSVVLLTIVLVRFIEYISKKEFFPRIRVTRDVDSFRIKYYILICAISIVLVGIGIWSPILCGLPFLFLVYRLLSWYVMNHVKHVAGIIHEGRKHHGTDK